MCYAPSWWKGRVTEKARRENAALSVKNARVKIARHKMRHKNAELEIAGKAAMEVKGSQRNVLQR